VSFGVERVTKDKPATVRLRIKPTTALKRSVIPSKLLAVLDDMKAKARRASAKKREAGAAKSTKSAKAKKTTKKVTSKVRRSFCRKNDTSNLMCLKHLKKFGLL
jgi:ribosomal protein L44E